MNAPLATPERMTVEQYLDWAQRQPEGRYELVDGVPQRMSPELNRQLLVKSAVYRAFHEAVRAASIECLVLPDGGTVVIHRFRRVNRTCRSSVALRSTSTQ